jgi:hypothetical protein
MRTVVDDIGAIVAEMRSRNGSDTPYYLYGHRKEIANKLLARNKDKMFTFQRYPLIALRMDFAEDRSEGMIRLNLNLGIFAFTDMNYDAAKRYEVNFKPILYPLYDLFFEVLRESELFTWPGDLDNPPHTKIDRPYWGIEEREGNVRNIFNDPIDAIEILNLRVNQEVGEICVHVPRPEVKVFDETFDLTFV